MAQSSSQSAIRATLEKITKDVIISYETATNSKNPKDLSRHLAPNCLRYIAPAGFMRAFGAPSDFSMTNDVYEVEYEKHLPVWFVKSTEIYNLTVDTDAKKTAARSIHHGEFSDGEKLPMEFGWYFDFNEDGTEVVKILEFVDAVDGQKHSQKCNELLDKMKATGA